MKNKINLNSSELLECRSLFHKHYRLKTGKKINDSIKVNWLAFKRFIETGSGIFPNDEIVLRFIHRIRGNEWFLTMECCHINSEGFIDITGNRFDITNSSICESNFSGRYDARYQSAICFDGVSLRNLTVARSVSFPWVQEFVEAARVNNVLFDESVDLNFVGITYDFASSSNLVKYPHLLAMFFSSPAEGNMINDGVWGSDSLIIPFKAFNYGRPCPPNCDRIEDYELFFDKQPAATSLVF